MALTVAVGYAVEPDFATGSIGAAHTSFNALIDRCQNMQTIAKAKGNGSVMESCVQNEVSDRWDTMASAYLNAYDTMYSCGDDTKFHDVIGNLLSDEVTHFSTGSATLQAALGQKVRTLEASIDQKHTYRQGICAAAGTSLHALVAVTSAMDQPQGRILNSCQSMGVSKNDCLNQRFGGRWNDMVNWMVARGNQAGACASAADDYQTLYSQMQSDWNALNTPTAMSVADRPNATALAKSLVGAETELGNIVLARQARCAAPGGDASTPLSSFSSSSSSGSGGSSSSSSGGSSSSSSGANGAGPARIAL